MPNDLTQRRIRVRAEWRDHCAGVVYLLQEYHPPTWLRFLGAPSGWDTVTLFTTDVKRAQGWCAHYGVEIEYEAGLKAPALPPCEQATVIGSSYLIIWEEIARLNGKRDPQAVAKMVLALWGDKEVNPETTKEIIRHLRSWNNAGV